MVYTFSFLFSVSFCITRCHRSRGHKQDTVWPASSLSFSTSSHFTQPPLQVWMTPLTAQSRNGLLICQSLTHGVMGPGDGVFRWIAEVTWGSKCSGFHSKHLHFILWKVEDSHRYDYIGLLDVPSSSYRFQENWISYHQVEWPSVIYGRLLWALSG